MRLISRKRLSVIIAFSLLGTGFPFSLNAAAAAEDNKLSVSMVSKELVLKDPKNPNPELIVAFAVEGPGRANIKVEVLDVALSEANRTTTVKAGSTSYSLSESVGVRNGLQTYRPNGNRQIFKSSIFPKKSSVKGAKFGAVVVTMQPITKALKAGSASSSAQASFKTMIFMYNYGYKGSLSLNANQGVELQEIKVGYPDTRAPIDFLIPDLPFMIHDGPINVLTKFTNNAELPQVAELETSVLVGSEVIVRSLQPRRPLLPEQSNEISVSTLSKKTAGYVVDSLPDFGFITIKSTLVSSLGGSESKAKTIERTYLVAPWKNFLVLISGLGAYLWMRRKNPKKTSTSEEPPAPKKPGKPGHKKSLARLFVEQMIRDLKKKLNSLKNKP